MATGRKTTKKRSDSNVTTTKKTGAKKSRSKKSTARKGSSYKTRKAETAQDSGSNEVEQESSFQYCCARISVPEEFDSSVTEDRAALIRTMNSKWVNGTRLHYYFFTKSGWKGTAAELDVVRAAFAKWKAIGIGLEFIEVDAPEQAEIRIGFKRGEGAWSYIGRHILDQGQSDRTMNFGWNIRDDIDTAIHEIGHTLGFPHEHQNPNAGIQWNEEAVYSELAKPPNNWSRDVTHWNIIRKELQSEVEGSEWDKDSIMHYPFSAGMINQPEIYQHQPLIPKAGLSVRDKEWMKLFYPKLAANDYRELKAFRSVQAKLEPGDQVNYYFKPTASRKYTFSTFGDVDTVMVLFEEVNGDAVYVAGDDDSGYDLNAMVSQKLLAGRTYILRSRLYWQDRKGDFAVMAW